jgi:hypothetical protein
MSSSLEVAMKEEEARVFSQAKGDGLKEWPLYRFSVRRCDKTRNNLMVI